MLEFDTLEPVPGLDRLPADFATLVQLNVVKGSSLPDHGKGPDWPRVYLVRHGETDWNAEGRLLSRTDRHQCDRRVPGSSPRSQPLGYPVHNAPIRHRSFVPTAPPR